MVFRSRDMVAMVMALILSRMAWNDSTESLQASVDLAFYFPREEATTVTPMDVDGDGTNEALAVVQRSSDKSSSSSSWVLRVLDLKALHSKGGRGTSTSVPPFQPNVLFETVSHSHQEDAHPVQLTAGQVIVKRPVSSSKRKIAVDESKVDDRTRHYFCGNDWHHAASKCSTPCPSGQASDCPNGERCFADTPCDIHDLIRPGAAETTQVLFELTPGGGLPSVTTLWSNGVLSLHSITKDKPGASSSSSSSSSQGNTKAKSSVQSPGDLELREMWHHHLIPESIRPTDILWIESNVLFLDAYESMEAIGADHGMIIVSGIYLDISNQEKDFGDGIMESSFLVALDALEGKVLWDSFVDQEKNANPLPLPLVRGTSSIARRRSRIAQLHDAGPTTLRENQPNCQVTFKQHLANVLPYAYWTPNDSHLAAFHLDQSGKHAHSNHKHLHPMSVGKDAPKHTTAHGNQHHHHDQHHGTGKRILSKHFSKRRRGHPQLGRPNVLVTQSKGGMQIRSLRNGRPLCHMSLLEETLYADLNNDGAIDQVQVLLPNAIVDFQDKWVGKLLSRVEGSAEESDSQTSRGSRKAAASSSSGTRLCHALALSGIPAREELFSTPLCKASHEQTAAVLPTTDLNALAPVVVESLSGRRNSRDVVVALNSGMVHRLQGRSGRTEWTTSGLSYQHFPTWERSGGNVALLTRLQSVHVPAPLRPVLLAGENSLAVLSVKNGDVLALAPYPQTSNVRPILGEVSGDGTTDVIVLSMDGIWGFQVRLRPGNPVALRIFVGMLIFLLMLAALRNRFGGSGKDIRATDP